MNISVRLFAMLREQAGWRERRLELPDGATIADGWRALVADAPQIDAMRQYVRFARNGRYAAPDERLAEGDELAIIPPVAGGSEGRIRCELSAEPLDDGLLAELRSELSTAADGAVVLFVGQTRETPGTPAPGQSVGQQQRERGVEWLDYEAFEEMALATMRAILAETADRFGVTRLAMIHRTGRVPLGEPSVVIAAAAPHRGKAFEAVRYAIDELKARAPIWKSEHYADGSVWVGAEEDVR
jgi:molybdopterin converting factor subunit 1